MMRFLNPLRLMDTNTPNTKLLTTLSIETQFADLSNKYRSWDTKAARKLLKGFSKWNRKRFSQKQVPLLKELWIRYQAMLMQLAARAGISNAHMLGVALLEIKARQTRQQLLGLGSFADILWDVCRTYFGADIEPLRPKFLLWQFVDELPSCVEQGRICSLAYTGIVNAQALSAPQMILEKRHFDDGLEMLSNLLKADPDKSNRLTHNILSTEVFAPGPESVGALMNYLLFQ